MNVQKDLKFCESFSKQVEPFYAFQDLWHSWLPSNTNKHCNKNTPIKFQNEPWGRGTALKATELDHP